MINISHKCLEGLKKMLLLITHSSAFIPFNYYALSSLASFLVWVLNPEMCNHPLLKTTFLTLHSPQSKRPGRLTIIQLLAGVVVRLFGGISETEKDSISCFAPSKVVFGLLSGHSSSLITPNRTALTVKPRVQNNLTGDIKPIIFNHQQPLSKPPINFFPDDIRIRNLTLLVTKSPMSELTAWRLKVDFG